MRRGFVVSAAAVLMLAFATVAYGTVREVGALTLFSAPPCQDTNCRVLTRTTAFQLQVGTTKNVSRVPRDGSLVAYTLYLPTVSKKYASGFNSVYAGEPSARISILRYAPRKGTTKYRYQLVAQSKRINLTRYLGSTPTFAMPAPVEVKRGDIVGLTTDTWLPAFVSRSEDLTSTWRASRPKGKCDLIGTDDYTNFTTARMHEKIGQIKRYDCGYKSARVLYHATIVDKPVKTAASK